jgi:mono/diheme cytochrome c family protein
MRHLYLGLAVIFVATTSPAFAADAPAPSYAKDVAPFFKKYCVECHNSDKAKAGYNLDNYEGLIREAKKGKKAVVPNDPDASRALQCLEGTAKQMPPKKNAQPDKKEIKLVRDWIAAGAKNDQKIADAKPMPDKPKNKVRRGDDDDVDDKYEKRNREGRKGKRSKDDDD